MVWYFAYGSNLDKKQLEDRVGRWEAERRAMLEGYRLIFARGDPGHTSGKANVVESPGSVVYGAVFDLSEEQLKKLDPHEGINRSSGKPDINKRYTIPVRVAGAGTVNAYVYIMKKMIEENVKPSDEYLNLIVSGLRRFGYRKEVIENVKSIASGKGEIAEGRTTGTVGAVTGSSFRAVSEEDRIAKEVEEARKFKEVKKEDEFKKILEKYKSPEGKERAEKLGAEYDKWKKRGYSEKDAIRKAYASVNVELAKEKIKQLKAGGAPENDPGLAYWRKVLGHATTQHQEQQKFFTWNTGPAPPPPKKPPREGKEGEEPEEPRGKGEREKEKTFSEKQKEKKPEENIRNLARWFLRRMPETSYDLLEDAFMEYPTIKKLDDENQKKAKEILRKVYNEYFERDYGSLGPLRHPIRGTTSLARGGYRRFLGWKVPTSAEFDERRFKPLKDPLTRSAINRGRRILRRAARDYFKSTIKDANERIDAARKEIEKNKKAWDSAMKNFKDLVDDIAKSKRKKDEQEQAGIESISGMITGKESDQMGILKKLAGRLQRDDRWAPQIILQEEIINKAYKEWEDSKKKLEDLEKETDPKNFYENMYNMLSGKAGEIVARLGGALGSGGGQEYWRYGNVNTEVLKSVLDGEAKYLASYYGKIARSRLLRRLGRATRVSLGLRTMSVRAQTSADVWHSLLGNLWNLITGPWTIGTIFILIQFYFITMWIGYHSLLLFWIPIVGAVLAFILNFESSKQPLDWIGHLAAGAMISYAFVIIFYSLGITMDTLGGTTGFFIFGGIIFVLIGLFQFYQLGGFRQAVMLTIIALLFGYVALGPYSGYWQVVKDQVKTPLNMAWRAIKGAVTDVWLLATNPTEWYARQQLVNVRPEKPIDFPKGVEVTLFDVMPPTVPGGQEFAVTAVFKNEGELKASNIKVSAKCNNWCGITYIIPDSKFEPKDSEGFFAYKENSLDRKEADTITLSHLVAKTVGDREAEFRMARVTLKVSYRYYTSASLFVDVMSEDELQRLFREGKDVYRNVLAIEKVTPAKLSLNVGPQPLKEGTKNALLLLSISNARDDGEIKLHPGDTIRITMPNSIGSGLECSGQRAAKAGNNEVLDYRIQSDLTIKAYDFSSIFAILCSFDVAETQQPVVSGLITAELGNKEAPGYEFVVKKEKDVPITTPLGIFFDPFERACGRCGEGIKVDLPSPAPNIGETCNKEKCHAILDDPETKAKGKCWLDSTRNNPIYKIFGDSCRSCGFDTEQQDHCKQFIAMDDCLQESAWCRFNCKWHELTEEERKNLPVSAGGANIRTAGGWCESGVVLVGECKDISPSYRKKYNSYAIVIDAAITKYGLKDYSTINPNALVAAIITQESSWDERASGDGGKSIGLMQINVIAHSECDVERIKQSDTSANIDCGVKVLKDCFDKYFYKTTHYDCTNKDYTGVNAVLRCYNGWAKDCSGDRGYVERIYEGIGADKGKDYKGYLSWVACIEKKATTTMPKLGDADYCKNKIEISTLKCNYGEGICDDNQCNTVQVPDKNGVLHSLDCRDPGIGKKLCCLSYTSDEEKQQFDKECIDEFNTIKNK